MEEGAGGADVEAHEAVAAGAEHGAVVEGQAGTVDKEVDQRVVAEAQGAAVEPDEEGGLRAQGPDERQVVAAVVFEEADVVLDVGEHLAAPLLAVLIGGDGGDGREEGRVVQLVGLKPRVEASAQGVVGHNGIAADDAGNVEGLGGCAEGDADLCCLVADGGKGHVAVAEEGHVAVYLVAEDDNVAVVAEAGQPAQRVGGPAEACGVVRIAEDEQLAALVGHLGQLFEVHVVAAVGGWPQGVVHHLASVALGRDAEGVVDGRLDDDLVAGL